MSAVLLWSQYSRTCMSLLNHVKNISNLKTICIDSPDIRQQILNSEKVKIKSVPCVLDFQDGKLLQYEGDQAVQWLNLLFIKHNQQQPQQPQQTMMSQPQGSLPSQLPTYSIAQSMPDTFNRVHHPQGVPNVDVQQTGMPSGVRPQQTQKAADLPPENTELKFAISAGPYASKQEEMDTPNDGRTPIHQVVPEPSQQQGQFQQLAQQQAQNAQQFYSQYQQPQQQQYQQPQQQQYQQQQQQYQQPQYQQPQQQQQYQQPNQQFQGDMPAELMPDRQRSPKETAFQQVLEKARREAAIREKEMESPGRPYG